MTDEADQTTQVEIRKRAMDLLARREHAYGELVTKLAKRDYARDDIEIALDTLVDDGLLSDARFAEASVAAKARRGIGPVRIRAELRGVGVADSTVEAALAAAEVDWASRAAAAREKRFGIEWPEDFAAKAKQMRFLQRRGFDGDQLAAAFDDAPGL